MDVLVFDLRGSLGHFRRPDTTSTHATYPFITRTALRGLLGSVLGLEEFLEEDAWTGIRLLRPVRTRAQELSLLGKGFLGSGPSFGRQTSVELVVQPHYRIFYSGAYMDELEARLSQRQSVYHTYLGSAFALTTPEWKGVVTGSPCELQSGERVTTRTVVPTHAVERLEPIGGSQYARAGGLLYNYLGGRRFRGTINLVYEVNGGPLTFLAKSAPYKPPVKFVRLEEGDVVCLW